MNIRSILDVFLDDGFHLSEIPGVNTVSDAFIALSMFTYVHKTVS